MANITGTFHEYDGCKSSYGFHIYNGMVFACDNNYFDGYVSLMTIERFIAWWKGDDHGSPITTPVSEVEGGQEALDRGARAGTFKFKDC